MDCQIGKSRFHWPLESVLLFPIQLFPYTVCVGAECGGWTDRQTQTEREREKDRNRKKERERERDRLCSQTN